MQQDKTKIDRVDDAPTKPEKVTKSSNPPGSYETLGVGWSVDRYVIVSQLGEGGVAKVFSGYDTKLGRIVALKVLHPRVNTPSVRSRLLREAQAMARLTHHNVVAVYDVGTFKDNVFIAMEYIEGTTLKQWLREKRPWREVLDVLKAAGRGLAAAHEAGLVHRDFKPENVLIGKNGRVVVSDFGIVRAESDAGLPSVSGEDLLLEGPREPVSTEGTKDVDATPTLPAIQSSLQEQLTEIGSVLGTTGYISPERAMEGRDDARSDQFSFCVTLYLALYGRHPHVYKDFETYVEALGRDPQAPPDDTDVPAWIHNVLRRGLERKPEARFESMNALLAELDRDPWRLRRYVILGVCACIVCLAIGLGYVRNIRALEEQSRAGEQIMATMWNSAKKGELGKVIGAAEVPGASDIAERVVRTLDNYAADWVSAHRRVSEATLLRKTQSKKEMEQRLSCLDRAREELDALVKVLQKTDATVAQNAIIAVHKLQTSRRCTEEDAARIALVTLDDPQARRQVLAARHALAQADALAFTGKPDEALKILDGALAEVRKVRHGPTEAELLLAGGAYLSRMFDVKRAISAFDEAFTVALASGSDGVAARAAANMAFEFPTRMGKAPEGAMWAAIARALLDRIGNDKYVEADVIEGELSVADLEGREQDAMRLIDRQISLMKELYGSQHPDLAAALTNKSSILNRFGKFDLSVAAQKSSIELQERVLGSENHVLSVDYNNLGSALTSLGRYEEAKKALDRALYLGAKLGELNASNAVTLASLAILENRMGNTAGALEAARKGLAIIETSGEDAALYRPWYLVERGRAILAQNGDASPVLADCKEILEAQEKENLLSPDQIYGPDALTCLGEAELKLGRFSDALAHLERSVLLTQRETPADLPLARFALARALWTSRKDPERALILAAGAKKDLQSSNGCKRDLAVIDDWMKKVTETKTGVPARFPAP